MSMRTLRWSLLTGAEKRRALARPALESRGELTAKVAQIIAAVRSGGDQALRDFTARFDRVALERFAVTAEEFAGARAALDPKVKAAMERAARNIETFHRAQKPVALDVEVSPGIRCERQARAIERIGLYAPGGSASLPSTVLMLGIPSRIVGNSLRVLCTPPRADGSIDPHILAAADLCGIETVFKLGGAQAIAALAYGTESVPKVDKIFGPGNSWVTEAKEQVATDAQGAAIDMPAGPSEVLVIADRDANPRFVAADLLSQAEHGPDSQVVLVSDSASLIEKVERELAEQLPQLPRAQTAREALEHSVCIQVESLAEAIAVSNEYAPEHLILQLRDAAQYKARIQNAGSVFVGAWSPESAGDYASGTNHVLPTYGYARAVSGLSVDSFVKQITFQELTPQGLLELGPAIETLAAIEGLDAHRRAVTLRLEALREAK